MPHVEIELLRAAYARKPRNLHLSLIASGVGGALLYFFFFRSFVMLAWVFVIWMVMLVGYVEVGFFKRTPLDSNNFGLWQRVFFGQSVASGLAWSVGPCMLLGAASGSEAGIFATTLLAVSAVATNSLVEQRASLAGFLAAALLPTTAALSQSADPALVMVAVVLASGFALMTLVGFDFHASIRSLIQTQSDMRLATQEALASRVLAEQAAAVKTQFLANMSHEIRTPMHAVLGMLGLLRSTPLEAQQNDYAEKAERASTNLLRLLDDVLDHSKISANKLVLSHEPFRLDELLDDVAVVLRAATLGKPVRFSVDAQEGLRLVWVGDAHRLRQVLINLGGNAIKFTMSGSVNIAVSANQDGELGFKVSDTGIGISADDLLHIFDGFSQAEASTTRRFGGTGLGLTISQQLVGLMGGRLVARSRVGEGSCFEFSLPLLPSDQALTARASVASGSGAVLLQQLRGMRVLVAEDNAINQQIASELLGAQGAIVTLVNDGGDAVSAVMAAPFGFDAVLMDLQMPVMDGLTATRAIRSGLARFDRSGGGDALVAQLPIIAMTANAFESDRLACFDAGMNDHVGKPFAIDDLVTVLLRFARAGAADVEVRDQPDGRAPFSTGVDASTAQPSSRLVLLTDPAVAEALARLGGDLVFYRDLLADFLRQAHADADELDAFVARKDWAAAGRLLHTVGGLAGAVGAAELRLVALAAQQHLALCTPNGEGGVENVVAGGAAALPGSNCAVFRQTVLTTDACMRHLAAG